MTDKITFIRIHYPDEATCMRNTRLLGRALLLGVSACVLSAGPAFAQDSQSTGNSGVGSGNNANTPVNGSANVNCNGVGVLGLGVGTCGDSDDGYRRKEPVTKAPGPRGTGPSPAAETPDNKGDGGSEISQVEPVSKSEPGLPVTGASVGIVAGAGAALLLGGSTMFVIARRRKQSFTA